MSNPYFRNSYSPDNSEHQIYNNANNEITNMFGRDFIYLPQTRIKNDYILGEDTLTQFNSGTTITLYVESFETFDGDGDIFSKFSLQIDDRLTLTCQKEEFDLLIGKKPEEEDLIFYPSSGQIFKVNYVNLDDSFWQLSGQNMTYRMECILYRYSHETLNTGNLDIDNIGNETDSNNSNEETQLTDLENSIIDFTDEDFFN